MFSMPCAFHSFEVIDVDGLAIAEQHHQNRQADGRFGRATLRMKNTNTWPAVSPRKCEKAMKFMSPSSIELDGHQ